MLNKKVIVLIITVSFLIITISNAQLTGSPHDLSNNSTSDDICSYCHVATNDINQTPLWNRKLSTVVSYGLYNSPTLDAIISDVGNVAGEISNVSQLCMSCHDGTIAVDSTYNINGTDDDNGTFYITGNALIIDLTDDHPVNFPYNATLATTDGNLTIPISNSFVDTDEQVPLFDGTVQCPSCHDVHDNTNVPFLVKSNANSVLCLTCHDK